ncbi:hypothetical protein DNU06_00125 [Putridiphycobacter roseus]|uniref:Carboxypeptidase-like regulatory domain-containing protein n=1 Tax=Putridiphycobacter roseus TaxID=2219161 RepID=A0A2W1N1X3_9FLAO|nr:carboxypeptidase-like regulatory domain-containing protein [Putridiphycobacter roseus]PZE18277.1 hypothetical protein DNU06_00125 [Putridiphycobacter roseus]
MRWVYVILFLGISACGFTQKHQSNDFQGYVLSAVDQTQIPFAVIFNHALQKGVLANENGYFEIPYAALSDSVTIKVIGYKTYFLKIAPQQQPRKVYLQEKNQLLSTVTVNGIDNTSLFNYLIKVQKKATQKKRQSKAYFYLKTYINQKQIELVECFYNASIRGYDIEELFLKSGRFGLQYYNRNLFVSVESAQALNLNKLLQETPFFPINPLQLSKRGLKKTYRIKRIQKYLNEDKDSTFVLKLTPKDTSGNYFYAKIWYNQNTHQLEKISLNCPHAIRHPFSPLFPTDKILNIDLSITKTFKKIVQQSFLEHLDFNYALTYQNRLDSIFTIHSTAVVQMYDFKELFFLPILSFSEQDLGTYRKLNAFPFNPFFWQNHQELKISDESKENNTFYKDSKTITNQTFFKSSLPNKTNFFEHSFIQWTGKRILFKPNEKPINRFNETNIISERYHLEARLFIDYNNYKDSVNLLIKTIFDPYKSFYYLPLSPKVHCFINMYFDLMEINRIELALKIKQSDRSFESVKKIYTTQYLKMLTQENQFLKEVQRGENKKEMAEWNQYIYEKTKINNLEIFLLDKAND